MSRTFTFGEKGTSNSQFYGKHLARIRLAAGESRVSWTERDLSFLLKRNYDTPVRAQIAAAALTSFDKAMRPPATGSAAAVRVEYASQKELAAMCKKLGIMDDLKAGVPRTAYAGVITLRMHGRLVYIAPSYRVDQDITKPLVGRLRDEPARRLRS